MLISQSMNLGRARAHDVIRRRNVLFGPVIQPFISSTCWRQTRPAGDSALSTGTATGQMRERDKNVRLSSHLGLKHLAVVLHALDVLGRLLLLHGSVDVLVAENAGHFNIFFVAFGFRFVSSFNMSVEQEAKLFRWCCRGRPVLVGEMFCSACRSDDENLTTRMMSNELIPKDLTFVLLSQRRRKKRTGYQLVCFFFLGGF